MIFAMNGNSWTETAKCIGLFIHGLVLSRIYLTIFFVRCISQVYVYISSESKKHTAILFWYRSLTWLNQEVAVGFHISNLENTSCINYVVFYKKFVNWLAFAGFVSPERQIFRTTRSYAVWWGKVLNQAAKYVNVLFTLK